MAKSAWDDIKFTWKDVEYVLPAEHIMKCIMKVEDVITFKELMECMSENKPKLSRIAGGYGVILRFCGCQVTDEEVYLGIFRDVDPDNPKPSVAVQAVALLLKMMLPPDSMQQKHIEVTKKGESEGRPQSPGAEVSASQKRSRRHIAGA
jgi:hypothetical protein